MSSAVNPSTGDRRPGTSGSAPGHHELVARQKEQFGGMKFGCSFFGWLTATGTAVLLTALLAAVAAALGLNGTFGAQPADSQIRTIGLVSGIVLLVVVLVGAALGDTLTGGGDNIADGLVPVVTVMFWSVVMDALTYRWPRLTRLLKGRPRPLIVDGRLDRSAMRREFISEDELLAQLRTHGLTEISQVRRAHLEANGEISVIPRDGGDSSSA